jgi:flavin reductase (DIM6/NTAB) family NADH-FMN oxidoreductase RutF
MTSQIAASKKEGENSDPWLRLQEPKEFSGLLYPNPVCFLCTPSDEEQDYQENVMTISWLTAINNDGCFVMSLNRRRDTSRYMEVGTGRDFCLCVPTAGMESLVLAVGGTSGRFCSKIARDEESVSASSYYGGNGNAPMSKRQRKRLERQSAEREGIPGLVRVPVGDRDAYKEGLFCIGDTVAHLHCRTYMIHNDDHVDRNHHIIYAQVIDAFCRSSYWNSEKKLFCPKPGKNPYLTFLGSQTFGYIVASTENSPEEATVLL